MPSRGSQRYDAVINTPLPGRNNRLAILAQNDKLQEVLFVSHSTRLKQPKNIFIKRVVVFRRSFCLNVPVVWIVKKRVP